MRVSSSFGQECAKVEKLISLKVKKENKTVSEILDHEVKVRFTGHHPAFDSLVPRNHSCLRVMTTNFQSGGGRARRRCLVRASYSFGPESWWDISARVGLSEPAIGVTTVTEHRRLVRTPIAVCFEWRWSTAVVAGGSGRGRLARSVGLVGRPLLHGSLSLKYWTSTLPLWPVYCAWGFYCRPA